jgi:HD-GYP domain-containing protein (c-di-GMP phosphodiesterase class II)
MREHPALAQRLLVGLPLPRAAIQAIRHHHERFDGSGYPDGLAGQSIPLGARIISVADAFHAITSDRPYRRRQTIAQALHEIERCAGTQFCPRVVGAFVRLAVRPGFGRPVCAA